MSNQLRRRVQKLQRQVGKRRTWPAALLVYQNEDREAVMRKFVEQHPGVRSWSEKEPAFITITLYRDRGVIQ